MTTGLEHARETGDPRGATTATRRVLLAVDHAPVWDEVVRAIEAQGIACVWVADAATPAIVAADLARSDALLIVDLGRDQLRGMNLVATCRQSARSAPVVVVAPNPSMELARRIRLSGVFYLALDPVSPEEMCSVVNNAFECLARHRPATSVYRARRRVLVVDDDADFVTSIGSLLESQGYAVSEARSGKEALEKVRAETPDLIVLDIMMEYDGSGYEVNEALKYDDAYECFRQVPILMVSSIDIDPSVRFKMAGEVDLVTPDGYLTKPLDIPKFLEMVKALLGERPQPRLTEEPAP